MQFEPFEPGIEVNGQTVFAIINGFRLFKSIPVQLLLKEGIGEPGPNNTLNMGADQWYSQEAWLRVFRNITKEVGDATLFAIGCNVPENAVFPPWVNDIDTAIRSIDIAYHLNHRKQGKVMFNPQTQQMLEGIGHYGFKRLRGEKKIISRCENPYPCNFDRGVVTAMAHKFERGAFVKHDDTQPCRAKGANSCTYMISWL